MNHDVFSRVYQTHSKEDSIIIKQVPIEFFALLQQYEVATTALAQMRDPRDIRVQLPVYLRQKALLLDFASRNICPSLAAIEDYVTVRL